MNILNKHKDPIPAGSVYIGRGSRYGNQFVLGVHGDRQQVVSRFRVHLARRLLEENSLWLKALMDLKDTDNLVCYCAPLSCHGDVIKEFYELIQTKGLDKAMDEFKAIVTSEPVSDLERLANPLEDGKTHINVYSGGVTKLGRWLSNFQYSPFEHPEHGQFDSVEGYWYWLSTGKEHDELRSLSGYQAKSFGKKLQRTPVADFKSQVAQAIFTKIQTNPAVARRIAESKLPFVHYYYYGNPINAKVVYSQDGEWIMRFLEKVRLYFQGKATRTIVAGSRGITDINHVRQAHQESGFNSVEIISGAARGVDRLGEQLAEELGIAVRKFHADWDGPDKKKAGFVRNGQMVDYGDDGVLIHDGQSPGTLDTKKKLEVAGKPCYLKTVAK